MYHYTHIGIERGDSVRISKDTDEHPRKVILWVSRHPLEVGHSIAIDEELIEDLVRELLK